MTILATNDDGIYAPGLTALYRELPYFGEVVVVAPDSEQSAVGHAISLSHPCGCAMSLSMGAFTAGQ